MHAIIRLLFSTQQQAVTDRLAAQYSQTTPGG